MNVRSRVKTTALCVVMPLLFGSLGGCAASNLIYPSTTGIDTIKQKTLSPNEQKAVIEDLQGTGDGTASKPLLETSTDPS